MARQCVSLLHKKFDPLARVQFLVALDAIDPALPLNLIAIADGELVNLLAGCSEPLALATMESWGAPAAELLLGRLAGICHPGAFNELKVSSQGSDRLRQLQHMTALALGIPHGSTLVRWIQDYWYSNELRLQALRVIRQFSDTSAVYVQEERRQRRCQFLTSTPACPDSVWISMRSVAALYSFQIPIAAPQQQQLFEVVDQTDWDEVREWVHIARSVARAAIDSNASPIPSDRFHVAHAILRTMYSVGQ